MIKFFRKIRRKLLSENKFSKYLLYAFGEIILVVIGILIALQVNNWNELKKSNKEENILIKNLDSEFKTNLENLTKVKTKNEQLYNSTYELKSLIGKKIEVLSNHNIDSILFKAILITDFQSNHFVLSQLKNGGKLDIIKSIKLKKLLYEWDIALNNKTEAFNMLNTYFMNSLIPFLDKHASVSNIDYYGNYKWSRRSSLQHDSTKIFHMIEFDNRLENHIWNINSFNNAINNLIEIAKMITEEITKV